jgi:hypothetical protein
MYHNLITLNKIKNLRQKNIIKAFYNKNKSTSNQVKSTYYHPMLNLISNNIYYSTLKSLKNLDTLEVYNEDSIFLQESFTQLCQTNNIDIPQPQTIKEKITITEPKESSSAWGKAAHPSKSKTAARKNPKWWVHLQSNLLINN